MVVVPVPSMNQVQLKDILFDQYHIEVPVTQHQGQLFIRISIQAYNTAADAEALVAAVKEIFRL
jgi:isopenicillin-N epimerase